jgi:hypothetical protein
MSDPLPEPAAPFCLLRIDALARFDEAPTELAIRPLLLALRPIPYFEGLWLGDMLKDTFEKAGRVQAGSVRLVESSPIKTPLGPSRMFATQAWIAERWSESVVGPRPSNPDEAEATAWRAALGRCLGQWCESAPSHELRVLDEAGLLFAPLFFAPAPPRLPSEADALGSVAAQLCAIFEKEGLGAALPDAMGADAGGRKARSL